MWSGITTPTFRKTALFDYLQENSDVLERLMVRCRPGAFDPEHRGGLHGPEGASISLTLVAGGLDQGVTITGSPTSWDQPGEDLPGVRNGEVDRDVEAVRYKPRPAVPAKLDPYKAVIRERLREFPELPALRLFEHPGRRLPGRLNGGWRPGVKLRITDCLFACLLVPGKVPWPRHLLQPRSPEQRLSKRPSWRPTARRAWTAPDSL